jgi:ubiquitin
MQIFIRPPNGKMITLEVDLSDTIESIKRKIQEKEGFPPDKQQLSLDGTASKPLDNDSTLGDYDIQGGNILNLTIAVPVPDRGSGCCCCNII